MENLFNYQNIFDNPLLFLFNLFQNFIDFFKALADVLSFKIDLTFGIAPFLELVGINTTIIAFLQDFSLITGLFVGFSVVLGLVLIKKLVPVA